MNRRQSYTGQALIPVLFAMLALTALAVTISMAVHRSIRASANYSINNQRFFAAQGAMNYAMAALAQSSNNGDTYGIVQPDPTADTNGWWKIGHCWVKIEVAPTGIGINLNSVTLTQLQMMPVFQTNPTLAQAIIDWRTPTSDSLTGIENQQNGSAGGSGTASTPSGSGGAGGAGSASQQPSAEGQYYTQLPQPYSPVGAGYDSVRELLLVEGMTPTILYSTPAGQIAPPPASGANGMGAGSPSSSVGSMMTRQAAAPGGSGAAGAGAGPGGGAASAQSSAAEQFASIYQASTLPLSELFTTVSRSLNVTSTGAARVNVNSATAAAMEQAGISARYANAIVTYRNQQKNGQSANVGAGGNGGGRPGPGGARPGAPGGARPGFRPGGGGAVRPRATPAAPAAAPAGAGNGQVVAGGAGAAGGGGGTTANTPVFATIGDLLKVGGINAQAMQQIADLVTTTNNPYLVNVVDLNTAPQEVLAMVPGMDTTLLDAIMQYRQSGQAFQTMDDYFSLPGVSNATFEATAGSLTAKCSTYRIRILVRTEDSTQVYAVSSIVEITANGPQVLQWRRVQRAPGWTQWGAPPPQLPPPTTSSSQTSATGLQ